MHEQENGSEASSKFESLARWCRLQRHNQASFPDNLREDQRANYRTSWFPSRRINAIVAQKRQSQPAKIGIFAMDKILNQAKIVECGIRITADRRRGIPWSRNSATRFPGCRKPAEVLSDAMGKWIFSSENGSQAGPRRRTVSVHLSINVALAGEAIEERRGLPMITV